MCLVQTLKDLVQTRKKNLTEFILRIDQIFYIRSSKIFNPHYQIGSNLWSIIFISIWWRKSSECSIQNVETVIYRIKVLIFIYSFGKNIQLPAYRDLQVSNIFIPIWPNIWRQSLTPNRKILLWLGSHIFIFGNVSLYS